MNTHIDTLGHARHSAGTTGGRGGQFATKTNDAPTDSLTAEPDLTTPKRSSQLTTDAIRESQQILTRTAAQITRSFRIDPTNAQDIVQDSWVHLLERDSRHGDIADRVTERAFLNLTARKYGNDYGNDARFGLRSEDFRARRELRAHAERFAAEKGRKMTPDEYAAAAGEIRMSYKPGQRPKPDFYKEISQLSIDVTISDDGATTLGDTLEAGAAVGFDHQEDAAASALHNLENNGTSKDAVRDDIWRIMSLRTAGAPQPVTGAVAASDAATHRRLVTRAGGAHKLALAWLDGDLDESGPEAAALFAPFGDIDNKQRERVVDVLDAKPEYADRLWASGLAAASR